MGVSPINHSMSLLQAIQSDTGQIILSYLEFNDFYNIYDIPELTLPVSRHWFGSVLSNMRQERRYMDDLQSRWERSLQEQDMHDFEYYDY